ncbi:DNA polymerase IV [Candidatus Uhrbacteria bacterium]|nr:DNA polymerase IV [Candidatus Uhrbacteria bacterium]
MTSLYIFHIDADAFFASCEQAMHPELEGRAVITGAERGIVSSASYEAKSQGVSRGTPLWEVTHIIPSACVVASDYESYGIFSQRMFSILRRYISLIEEYSIDEAFGVIPFRTLLEEAQLEVFAKRIQDCIHRELGISVSIGIGKTKVLAKIGSKYKKPNGITVVHDSVVPYILPRISVGDLWGIGSATQKQLSEYGIHTAWDFYCMDELAVARWFTRPILDVWCELHSKSCIPMQPTSSHVRHSIQKVRTFSPPSNDRKYVFSQVMYNLENSCIKARRYSLFAKRIGVYLRTKEYRSVWKDIKLTHPSAFPTQIVRFVSSLFDDMYDPREYYRSTGIVLDDLVDGTRLQASLFESHENRGRMRSLFCAIDALDRKFGKHTVLTGASLPVRIQGTHRGVRNVRSDRFTHRLTGETDRQHLKIPFFFINI